MILSHVAEHLKYPKDIFNNIRNIISDDGLLFVEYENETLPKKYRKIEKIIFSSKFACPESGFTIEEIEPRLFSFNSPMVLVKNVKVLVLN